MNSDVVLPGKDIKISKGIKCFYFILHFILGLDLGYIKHASRKIQLWIYLYGLVHSGCVCANVFVFLYFEKVDISVTFWISTMLIQHIFNTTVLTFSDKTLSFHDLQVSLATLDLKLAAAGEIRVDGKILFFCALSFAYRSVVTYFFCIYYEDECVNSVVGACISHFQLLANDSLLIVSFFMFYTVYLRMNNFEQFVKNNKCGMLENLDIYKRIVDMVEKAKKLFDKLYAVSLLVATPNLIITAYMGLTKLKNQNVGKENMIRDNIARVLYCLQDFGLLFAPAISAGLLASAVEKLRLTLYDRVLRERDEDDLTTIELFISYVQARSLTLTVFQVIRLDWTLPVLIVNLCITYQIVIVQITHLY